MSLKFMGIDPGSAGGNCPSVWLDDQTGDLILQGWEVDDQASREEVAGRSPIGANERVVRLPARMREMIAAACLDTQVASES